MDDDEDEIDIFFARPRRVRSTIKLKFSKKSPQAEEEEEEVFEDDSNESNGDTDSDESNDEGSFQDEEVQDLFEASFQEEEKYASDDNQEDNEEEEKQETRPALSSKDFYQPKSSSSILPSLSSNQPRNYHKKSQDVSPTKNLKWFLPQEPIIDRSDPYYFIRRPSALRLLAKRINGPEIWEKEFLTLSSASRLNEKEEERVTRRLNGVQVCARIFRLGSIEKNDEIYDTDDYVRLDSKQRIQALKIATQQNYIPWFFHMFKSKRTRLRLNFYPLAFGEDQCKILQRLWMPLVAKPEGEYADASTLAFHVAHLHLQRELLCLHQNYDCNIFNPYLIVIAPTEDATEIMMKENIYTNYDYWYSNGRAASDNQKFILIWRSYNNTRWSAPINLEYRSPSLLAKAISQTWPAYHEWIGQRLAEPSSQGFDTWTNEDVIDFNIVDDYPESPSLVEEILVPLCEHNDKCVIREQQKFYHHRRYNNTIRNGARSSFSFNENADSLLQGVSGTINGKRQFASLDSLNDHRRMISLTSFQATTMMDTNIGAFASSSTQSLPSSLKEDVDNDYHQERLSLSLPFLLSDSYDIPFKASQKNRRLLQMLTHISNATFDFDIPNYDWSVAMNNKLCCLHEILYNFRFVPPSYFAVEPRDGKWFSSKVKIVGCGDYTILVQIPWTSSPKSLLSSGYGTRATEAYLDGRPDSLREPSQQRHRFAKVLRVVKIFDMNSFIDQHAIIISSQSGAIEKSLTTSNEEAMYMDYYTKHFRREIWISLKIPRHRHVCRTYGWFHYGSKIGLVMERLFKSFAIFIACFKILYNKHLLNHAAFGATSEEERYRSVNFSERDVKDMYSLSEKIGEAPNLKFVPESEAEIHKSGVENLKWSLKIFKQYHFNMYGTPRHSPSAKGAAPKKISNADLLPPLIKMLCFFRDAAIGLDHIHAHHIVHRDLKPSNIMMDENGRVVVIDFGNACIMSDCIFQCVTGNRHYQPLGFLKHSSVGRTGGGGGADNSNELRYFVYSDGSVDVYALLLMMKMELINFVPVREWPIDFVKRVEEYLKRLENILISISSSEPRFNEWRSLERGNEQPYVPSEQWYRWHYQKMSQELPTMRHIIQMLNETIEMYVHL